jgi:hypothetical protein
VPDASKLVAEYRRRATEARRMADAASTPAEKKDLLEVERRWLRLARNHEAKIRASSQTKRHRNGGGAV